MSRYAFWRDLILMTLAMTLAPRLVAVLTFPEHVGWDL